VDKLTFQDLSFLRLESPQRPFHVGGLMIFKRPPGAAANYLRGLAKKCGRLNEIWPIFNKKLHDPDSLSKANWVPAQDYQAGRHVLHYSLPAPGTMQDLIHLVCCAHEQLLDRNRPLWQMHIIEGLPGDRFALYCKVHHALVDGAGALKMIEDLFSTSAQERIQFRKAEPLPGTHVHSPNLWRDLEGIARGVLKQYDAMPQLSNLLKNMGVDAFLGKEDAMALPYTAPRSLFNTEVDSQRRIIICDLPFNSVKALAKRTGGTINDVLLAVCGSALRRYLLEQDALPRKSLIAGMPVSLKSGADGDEAGNQLGFILCPFFTDEPSDIKRLQRIIRITRKGKDEMSRVSSTVSRDFANMLLMPTILLTLTGNATSIPPGINAIFSNVPGSRQRLYLEGSQLESMYPLSVVTDAMGINLTVVSYGNKLCFAITSCPTRQPGIEALGGFLKHSFKQLQAAVKQL
jgi:diacylglycerol O-acyltransferase